MKLVGALLAMVCLTPAVFAQTKRSAVILGTVADSSLRPVIGADVSFAGSLLHVATDSLGRFRVTNVPAGHFVLVARGIGYAPATSLVDVTDGDTLRLAFTLDRSAQTLETVVVKERSLSRHLAEFEQRRKAGMGRYFTRDDIEAKNPATIADLIRTTFGVRIQPARAGSGSFAVSSRRGCPLEVYLDGMPMSGPAGPFDLSYLPQPDQIVAVEIYANPTDVAPAWLPRGSNRTCGDMLVWTASAK
jgi:hypothetical protein